ncbi:peptide-methionine (S)-S-oxide reductase MsrA [Litorilituus sediminis]|uniref:Peptide methionine sulfoxide reductase MsrA n=1 Tax=Litorilituus sediminis TaxID=718192 RepID=A0A4P6P784_9GAMM|nr:peptide-methionine (S)-S-oxide reductase MsrA [Litorilituus sediminis]QBG36069.1 peptide-methionine (S)-S-oxide reductase [Litorilituus sediminis]
MTEKSNKTNIQQATLAGGCFWCIEAAYNSLQGIEQAVSGYMGGDSAAPTYKEVCAGDTGHAEVVRLTFDADIISYREILEIFFTLHDPTQLNRQGNDIGTQYRSEIFFENDEQQVIANEIIAELSQSGAFEQDIVTKVTPVSEFYCGEDYHQEYFNNNPENQYCQAVVSPKLAKFRKTFVSKLKGE